MRKFILIILVSTFCMCLKCEDSMLPEGIETKVYGQIYDQINDRPVINQKLIIQELNHEPGFQIGSNIDYIADIDSTFTDENGKYELVFETTGQGDTYQIFSPRTKQVWTYYQDAIEIEDIGASNEIDFNFLHLYPVNLLINVNEDFNFLPVRISHRYTLNRSLEDIETISNEINRQIYIPLNFGQTVDFYRTKPDGQNQVYSFEIPPVTTGEPFNLEIELKNSNFEDY
ncbi:hypothetical protein E0K83_12240 [Gramella sp. BOM4]|nr:hypothetical protein [Christiangramia bathymodioli]